MRIEIQASGFELTDGLREHTERRLQFALSWASHEVRKVVVRLRDINGPRGGNDKRCSIQIPLPRAPDIVIEDTESDLYVAIDRASDRAARSLARRLERQREYPHRSSNKTATPDDASVAQDVDSVSTVANPA